MERNVRAKTRPGQSHVLGSSMTWQQPHTTLGGAGMWDVVRSNGLYQLQRYKLEGTALNGIMSTIRSIYSEAPNYRIIASNSPYWEVANGPTEDPLQDMMNWLEANVMPQLLQRNIGGYAQGDADVKIRIIRDFMQSYVQRYGTINLDRLSDDGFLAVVSDMGTAPNMGNSQVRATVVTKNPVVASTSAGNVSVASPGSSVASVPFTSSQLVTHYERDPITGKTRQIQVYQPHPPTVVPPSSSYPGYNAPPPVNVPAGYPRPVFVPNNPTTVTTSTAVNVQVVGKLPSNVTVYQHARSPSGGSIASSVVYGPSSAAQQGQSQRQGAQPYASPNPYVMPNPYASHSNPYAPSNPYSPSGNLNPYGPPAGVKPVSYQPPIAQSYSAQPPQQQLAPSQHSPPQIPTTTGRQNSSSLNAPLPVSQWDAPAKDAIQQPSTTNHASETFEPALQPPLPPLIPEAILRPSSPSSDSTVTSDPSSQHIASPFTTDGLTPLVPSSSPTPSGPPSDEDKNLCKLCFERDLDCAFLPCSHVACYECATTLKLTTCPFCRAEITKVLKLYRA